MHTRIERPVCSDITTTEPASYYVGITQTVSYGTTTLFSDEAGIVDTGTTLIYIPSGESPPCTCTHLVLIANAAGYKRYVSATGATLDDTTGLLRLSTADFDKLDDMTFTIGGVEYTFTANAQAWPRSVSTTHLGPGIR